MTVTWPIPPNSTIDPRTRPIPFQAERDVTAVSVSFGNRRAEERAYRDGAFVWPYLRSTRAGNLFTLVRDDGEAGWPADPKPFVDEEPPPTPIPTTFWQVLYECDLRTKNNQTLIGTVSSTYVNFTLDGQPWYVHAEQGSAVITKGVGMTCQARRPPTEGSYSGLNVGVKAYLLTGYDPTKRTAVQVRYSSRNSAQYYGASIWAGAEQWGMALSCNQSPIVRNDYTYSMYGPNGGSPIAQTIGINVWPTPVDPTGEVFAVIAEPWGPTGGQPIGYFQKSRSGWYQAGVGSNWPPMEAMSPVGTYNGTGTGENSAYKMGAWMGSLNVSTTNTFVLTQLRVLQQARPIL